MNDIYLSVIVPVFNEKRNIALLDVEIKQAVKDITDSFEIIYINDGSTDGSLEELKSLTGVTIITLNRNYGQAIALDAGFRAGEGEYIVSMDGDGQNDPRDIKVMLQKLKDEDLDVVAGWRKDRKDKGGVKFLTLIGRLLRRILIKDVVHDTGCTLRVYRKEAAKHLDIAGEMHRYILAILKWKGYRIGETVVHHRRRKNGKSKYTYSKAVRGFIDLLYVWFIHKYSQRPLHLFGYFSLLFFLLAFVTGTKAIYGKLFLELSLNNNGWFFIGLFAALAGIMLFSFGIVLDLLIRIQLTSSPHEQRYYVRGIIKTAQK